MNTLREAVEEYLAMRRGLGFKLEDTGKGLLDFVAFMEKCHAHPPAGSHLGTATLHRSTKPLGPAPEFRARFCAPS